MKKNLTDNIASQQFENRSPNAQCFILNDTSKSEIRDAGLVEIIALGNNNCLLTIPKKICAQGHSLSLYFLLPQAATVIKRFPTGGEIEHTIRVSSKVTKIEEIDDTHVMVFCEFNQYSKPQWDSYVNSFKELQKNILAEFAKIKGDE